MIGDCPSEHLCPMCGAVALAAGHQARRTCPTILVRCLKCARELRKLPGHILAVELWDALRAADLDGERAYDLVRSLPVIYDVV